MSFYLDPKHTVSSDLNSSKLFQGQLIVDKDKVVDKDSQYFLYSWFSGILFQPKNYICDLELAFK